MNPCEQADNIKRIQEDISNHKEWRKETTETLSDIAIQVATLNERLKSKMESFDEHVKAGTAFRATLVGLCVSLALTIGGSVFAYGRLSQQVDINTDRWDRLLGAQHIEVK